MAFNAFIGHEYKSMKIHGAFKLYLKLYYT